MRPTIGVPSSLNRRRYGVTLLITVVVTMLLAVAVNFIGLSEGGRTVAYVIIMVAGIAAVFVFGAGPRKR